MDETDFQLWIEQTAIQPGVLACGVKSSQSTKVRSVDAAYPEQRISDLLQALSEVGLTMRQDHLINNRWRWSFENGQIHSAKRSDGALGVLILTNEPVSPSVANQSLTDFISNFGSPNEGNEGVVLEPGMLENLDSADSRGVEGGVELTELTNGAPNGAEVEMAAAPLMEAGEEVVSAEEGSIEAQTAQTGEVLAQAEETAPEVAPEGAAEVAPESEVVSEREAATETAIAPEAGEELAVASETNQELAAVPEAAQEAAAEGDAESVAAPESAEREFGIYEPPPDA